jgi:hypothetical protein
MRLGFFPRRINLRKQMSRVTVAAIQDQLAGRIMSKSDWKETVATVFTCGVQEKAMPGKLPLPGFGYSEYLITFSYEIDRQWYSGEFTSTTPRVEGSTFTLKYDRNRPDRNEYSLSKAFDSLWGNIIMWAAAMVIAGVYIWFREFRHH